jgi:hypothetical protein
MSIIVYVRTRCGKHRKRKEGITMKVTFWKELRTGMIYKYYGDNKPFAYDTDWRQVTCKDFERQFGMA